MATSTIATPQTTEEAAQPQPAGLNSRIQQMHNPGVYAGAGLGVASAFLSGDPLLFTTIGATGIAAGWTALGMNPGPWRWLPGQGEPWEWLCRRSSSVYRRKARRMRRRLDQTANTPDAGLFVIGVCDGWRNREDRPALVREATAEAHRLRCASLRHAWANALPDWDRGWWRRYTPAEMVLRAGPVVAIPASGFADVPWWAHLAVIATATAWGSWLWHRPDPSTPAVETAQAADWYLARWQEWIAHERGPLPASKLTSLHVDDDKLTAIIVSTTTRPALGVDQDAVSIAFRVPPRAVNIYRPDDMPADRAKLTVKLRALTSSELDMDDLAAVWDEFGPYPGSKLYDAQKTEHGRSFKLLMPRKGASVADVQPRAIAQALDLDGEEAVARLHLRMLDARRIEVSEMTQNPLQEGVPLDLDALTMDDQGYIIVGKDVHGRPTKWRLLKFDAKRRGLSGQSSASAVHAFGSGTTGAGKTSLEEDLQVAQRLNGFISWLADGKGGAGYAPWMPELDWLLKSPYGAMLMGQAANAVSEYRYAEQMKLQWLDEEGFTEQGRSFFVPGEPFAPMVTTWDEFNEMILKDPQADHVKPLLRSVSSVGRLSRAAGIAARIWVQIPNLDSIGSDASANAIRDMLQSGNIALFRTARADVDIMSLGSRTPEIRLAPLPERFPNGSETGGLCYIADGKAQYTQSRAMFHSNPARVARQFPLETLTAAEADAAAAAGPAGLAYLRREEYRHLDAAEEEEFLRELVAKAQEKNKKNTKVITARPAPAAPAAEVEDDDLDELVPPTRSQLVWQAVDSGARRNKQIAEVTDLKPTNVANATARLERLGKLTKKQRDWHTAEPLDTESISA
ncbi:hypothetical protein [Streptomyces europaeiscabiei]|uniref:hypothetical protein n=1 Tax=Streptomyces europaeiscabiei TaxID=146819 RepID=UPI0029AF59DF|nr:hypothetical protein [Streptomyces europaeiscabiei]MDX2757873.1 hypothetical protein [Streptomyces europaeiscabiei]MDX3549472.1 hypothetical protein [Streptomyces europaeiscabiei]